MTGHSKGPNRTLSFFRLGALKVPFSQLSQCVQSLKIPVPRINHFGHFRVSGTQGSIYQLLNVFPCRKIPFVVYSPANFY